jgi:hypothetical protein
MDGVIILISTALTNGYIAPYTIVNYVLWCIQRYSVLFIPLLIYVGYKYKDIKPNRRTNSIFDALRDKIDYNKLRIISIIIFVIAITVIEIICFTMYYHVKDYLGVYNKFLGIPNTSNPLRPYLSINFQVIEWGILMISTYIIFIKSKFTIIFSFALTYLLFYFADILFEIPKTIQYTLNFKNFNIWSPALNTLILLIGSLVIVLYKLNVRLNLKDFIILFLSFTPLLFSWIYYYSIWSIQDSNIFIVKIPLIEPFDRLFAFPFIIILALYIYKSRIEFNRII